MKLRKIISFKQHEKYMFDFLNDKTLVPDASALIKDLLRAYIEQVNNKSMSNNIPFDDIINSQSPKIYENMVQNLKNQYSTPTKEETNELEIRSVPEKKQEIKEIKDEKVEETTKETEKILQNHSPLEDIIQVDLIEDETNDDMLRGLDL